MECGTDRMIMRTNLDFKNGKLVIPEHGDGDRIDILLLRPNNPLDGGFIFYDTNETPICHIGIRTDRKIYEISYGTETQYRKQGYMKEAVKCVLELVDKYAPGIELYGLICHNDTSEHILISCGFELVEEVDGSSKWYRYQRYFQERLERIISAVVERSSPNSFGKRCSATADIYLQFRFSMI